MHVLSHATHLTEDRSILLLRVHVMSKINIWFLLKILYIELDLGIGIRCHWNLTISCKVIIRKPISGRRPCCVTTSRRQKNCLQMDDDLEMFLWCQRFFTGNPYMNNPCKNVLKLQYYTNCWSYFYHRCILYFLAFLTFKMTFSLLLVPS